MVSESAPPYYLDARGQPYFVDYLGRAVYSSSDGVWRSFAPGVGRLPSDAPVTYAAPTDDPAPRPVPPAPNWPPPTPPASRPKTNINRVLVIGLSAVAVAVIGIATVVHMTGRNGGHSQSWDDGYRYGRDAAATVNNGGGSAHDFCDSLWQVGSQAADNPDPSEADFVDGCTQGVADGG